MRDLQKDLAICNKATPGPWVWGENTLIGGYWVQEYHGHPESSLADFANSNDAEFIADARNGWPHAIERAIKAEAEVTKWQDVAEQRLENALVVAQKVCRLEAENAKLRSVADIAWNVVETKGLSDVLLNELAGRLADWETWKEGER